MYIYSAEANSNSRVGLAEERAKKLGLTTVDAAVSGIRESEIKSEFIRS